MSFVNHYLRICFGLRIHEYELSNILYMLFAIFKAKLHIILDFSSAWKSCFMEWW